MESREDLKAFLDGELTVAQAEAIRATAESDSATERELAELRSVGSALSEMRQDYEPRGLEETLRALDGHRLALAKSGKTRKPWLGYGMGVGIAAVIALLYAIPPIFSASKPAAKPMLASRAFEANRSVGSPRGGIRPFRRQTVPPMIGKAGFEQPKVVAPKQVPLSLQDQIKAIQAKVDQLEKENQRLKGLSATMPPAFSQGSQLPLPVPPMSAGTIVPSDGRATSEEDNGVSVVKSRGISPKRVSELESQVRKIVAGAGAKVDTANGPTVMRVITVTTDTGKASHLADQIRGALKGSGNVTIENLPKKGDDEFTQNTLSKIVDLKLQRERLLVDFLPEAPQVKELDQQIKVLQASIKPDATPLKSRLHIAIG
jgi:tetrahydromethanopterin S-methyltransferase subunit B